jgi:hypothetical protein
MRLLLPQTETVFIILLVEEWIVYLPLLEQPSNDPIFDLFPKPAL